MYGVNVCYHHGGKSRRGLLHPNYKHGFYSKSPDAEFPLSQAFHDYRRVVRRQQIADLYADLRATMPDMTPADDRRFMAAVRTHIAQLPAVKLTPELAVWVLQWRWPDYAES